MARGFTIKSFLIQLIGRDFITVDFVNFNVYFVSVIRIMVEQLLIDDIFSPFMSLHYKICIALFENAGHGRFVAIVNKFTILF